MQIGVEMMILGKLLMSKMFTKTNLSYYLRRMILFIFKLKNICISVFSIKKIDMKCKYILKNSKFDVVDIFCFRFGWNAGSYQRAQHIAYNMSKNGVLVFYAINPYRDKHMEYFPIIQENLI